MLLALVWALLGAAALVASKELSDRNPGSPTQIPTTYGPPPTRVA